MRELTEKEGAEVDEDALTFIAKEADGSMRDALSLLDQCLAFHFGEKLTYEKALEVLGAVDDGIFAEIVQYISAGDSLNALRVVDEVSVQGRDFTQFVGNLLWYLRNLMLVKSSDVSPQSLEISTESLERLKEIAAKLELTTIMRYIRILSDLNADMKYSDQKRILLEIAVIRMCKPQMEEDVDSLIDRIRDLEKKSKGAQFIPLEMMGTMQGNPAGAVNMAKAKPVREKALPEDVKKVLGSWESIRETLEPLLANMLTNCRLSINDEDVLLVVPTEKLSEEYLKKEGAMDSLREAVAERVGKEVKMELKPLVDDDDFTDNYVDVVRMFGKLVVKDDTI
jgi:DNA polymerase III, gamma/tau subunits